jgi:PAS domain S-box-containing protein
MLEDRAADAALNERELRKAGIEFTALRVETEKQFRRKLLEFRPDLILADFKLPAWDGHSALAVAQAQCPEVPFVFVTGTLGEETAVEMILGGASDFILKQRVDRLGGAVLRALRSADQKKELNLAERRLRDSEVRYRGLFEGANDGILIVDAESGMIVDANPFLCNLLAVSLQQLLGKQASELDCLAAIFGHIGDTASLPATSITGSDVFVTTHDGRHLDLTVSSNMHTVNGRHLIQCNIHDITERKRLAEMARSVLQTAMDGVWIVDLEGRFLKVNAAYCTMSGYTRDELHTMRIGDVESVESAAETAAHVAGIVRDGSGRFESRHRRKDGTLFDVEVSATYPPGGGGRIFAFIHDITKRNAMQALVALKTSSIEAQADAIFWMTEEGRIHDVNAAACRLLGYTRVELLGRMVGDLDERWHAAAWAKQFSELRQRGSLRFEYEQLHRDGRRTPVEVAANYMKFDDLELNMSTVRDVSLRKKAETDLANQLDELRRWQAVMLDREDRIQQLKREVNDLAVRLGAPVKYPSQPAGAVADPAEQRAGATT